MRKSLVSYADFAALVAAVIATVVIRATVYVEDCNLFVVTITFIACFIFVRLLLAAVKKLI